MATTAHAFAKQLLAGPDLELFFVDSVGAQEVNSSPRVYQISGEDQDNCGDCEGRVGDEVVAFYV